MIDAQSGGAHKLVVVAGLGVAVFAAACFGVWLTRSEGRIATIWIANAIIVAALLRRPRSEWPAIVAAMVAANISANLIHGDSWAQAVALSLVNAAEALIVAVPLARRYGAEIELTEFGALGAFLVRGGLIAPLLAAGAGAGLLAALHGAPFLETAGRWYLADAVGLVIVAPLLLAISSRRPVRPPVGRLVEGAVLLALATAVTGLVFTNSVSFMFIIMPTLVLCAMRLSGGSVAFALLLVATIASAFTFAGEGPIAAGKLGHGGQILLLQAFIANAMLLTLPVHAVVAERARLAQALLHSERERRAAAESSSAARSRFLAAMSHEIRTPLTGVLGMIELLRDNPSDEERERYLAAMKQSAEMLTAVLNGILDFSKLESGRLVLAEDDFDLPELVRNTVTMFQNTASARGLNLVADVDSKARPMVRGDAVRIQQVLSNLISNAVKFTERGDVIVRVRARLLGADKQRWRIEVRDSGIGIAKADQQRLFEPFIQASDRRYGGTGLGLAISRRLVEAMGGKIGVRSIDGRGSTFWLTLDLPVGHRGSFDEQAALDTLSAPARPLHVLIAEDNPVNQMLIAALVRRHGHRTTCVDNGRRAVEASEAVGFDCILMDMQMPEMDGIAATAAIRRASGPNRAVPIVALTADAAPERRSVYNKIGLSGFMTKPVDPEALGALLAQIAAVPPAPRVANSSIRDRPAFDAERISDLHQAISQSRLEPMVDALAAELRDGPAALHRFAACGDFDQLRSRAHSLKGAVANFGASRVTRAAKSVELALPGTELDLALARLDVECGHALASLETLLDYNAARSCA